MASSDRCQVGDSIRPIMTVPEEIMRKIFSYLPFETLYFSLRKVCAKMQSYVDRYIKVAGPPFLVRRQEGSENQEIEITPIPKKGFIFLRKSWPSFISNSSILQNNTILVRNIQKLNLTNAEKTLLCIYYQIFCQICKKPL